MPKNLFQEIVFTVLMVFVMVYAMICGLKYGKMNE